MTSRPTRVKHFAALARTDLIESRFTVIRPMITSCVLRSIACQIRLSAPARPHPSPIVGINRSTKALRIRRGEPAWTQGRLDEIDEFQVMVIEQVLADQAQLEVLLDLPAEPAVHFDVFGNRQRRQLVHVPPNQVKANILAHSPTTNADRSGCAGCFR